jgi:hypothetical protein
MSFNDEIQQSLIGDITLPEVNIGNVGLVNTSEVEVNPATEDKQDDVIAQLETINSLTPSKYDYIALSYTGANLTGVVFKLGGSGGTTVSTIVLAYDESDNLTSVTKS